MLTDNERRRLAWMVLDFTQSGVGIAAEAGMYACMARRSPGLSDIVQNAQSALTQLEDAAKCLKVLETLDRVVCLLGDEELMMVSRNGIRLVEMVMREARYGRTFDRMVDFRPYSHRGENFEAICAGISALVTSSSKEE